MIKSIGLCQNVQFQQNLAFRAKQEFSPVTSPVDNVSMNGMDALAAYNSTFVKNKNMFDIPLLKPIEIPNDINAIDGERIYNSKGILQCIVKETEDKKYVYSYKGEDIQGINNLEIYDKKTGNKIFEQYEYKYFEDKEHTGQWLTKYDSKTGLEISRSKYEDGKPMLKETSIRNNDGSYENIVYNYNAAEYEVYGDTEQCAMNYDKIYDINGNLKYAYYTLNNPDGMTRKEIKYLNGEKISEEIRESRAIYNPELQNYIYNPELKPAACPEFITNIDNIEGKRTYYSNGQLESVSTDDGKKYEVSLDGHCITLYDGNKTVEYADDKEWGEKHCTVIEEFGDGMRQTSYSGKNGDELSHIFYTKGNIEKDLGYENNIPRYYSEYDTSKEDWLERQIISIDYAPNGGILDVSRVGDNY